MPETTRTSNVRTVTREALALIQSLGVADEIQWERSPVPQPREDTSQRASGGHGDPTGDIVLDPRRMAVREAVSNAETVLRHYAIALRDARLDVERSVARWNGED